MEPSKLQTLFESIEDKETYKDDAKSNSSLKSYRSLPSLSIQDGKFFLKTNSSTTLKELGDELQISMVAGLPQSGVSRALFVNGFNGGTQSGPDCFSPDGIRPASPNPVSVLCASCPKSKWGSGQNGVGTACRSSKTIIAILIVEEDDPIAVTLRISGSSLKNLSVYVDEFDRLELAVSKFVTKLSIDQSSKFPVIQFEVDQVFDAEDLSILETLTTSPEVQEQLNR